MKNYIKLFEEYDDSDDWLVDLGMVNLSEALASSLERRIPFKLEFEAWCLDSESEMDPPGTLVYEVTVPGTSIRPSDTEPHLELHVTPDDEFCFFFEDLPISTSLHSQEEAQYQIIYSNPVFKPLENLTAPVLKSAVDLIELNRSSHSIG